jgi:hypothetical protein
MFDLRQYSRASWNRRGAVVVALTAMVSLGSLTLFSPATAGASGATNLFTFSGSHSGTLKLTSSSLCLFGKAYSGGGYTLNISHMTGTITGAGKGEWDSSFQSNATPIIQFVETSGSVTYHGATGSIDMTFAYHPVGSQTYSGSTTVTGSWNCNS